MTTHRRNMIAWMAGIATVTVTTCPVLAHGGEAHTSVGNAWWRQWNFDALTLASLTILAGCYTVGLLRLWRRAGRGHGLRWRNVVAFILAMVTLFVALISPIDPLSDALGSAHMAQHMLIMMLAAPLFVLGAPMLVMLWSLPGGMRRRLAVWGLRVGGWRGSRYLLWQPVLVWVIFGITLWVWHVPTLYEAALRSRWIHEVQHITFFVGACLYWRALVDPVSRWRTNRGAGIIYLFTTSLHAMVLGIFMTLAPEVWYADYVGRTEAWRISALEDQQIAGLIMWMPGCVTYVVVAAAMFVAWLRDDAADEVAWSSLEGKAGPTV